MARHFQKQNPWHGSQKLKKSEAPNHNKFMGLRKVSCEVEIGCKQVHLIIFGGSGLV